MWSQSLLCLLVGLAYATDNNDYNKINNNPAWRGNQQYDYVVYGSSFASLYQVDRDASGVVLKAKLTIRPRPDGTLIAKISNAKHSPVHGKLSEDWNTNIPESQLSFKEMPISQKPFQIVTKNGVIRDLKVSQEVSNWEANFIKAIVSQFQLDTMAENVVNSHINALPKENPQSAVYKTMEDTVIGIHETLYEIKQQPKFMLQTKPWLAPLISQGENLIEIMKTKNHSRAQERPSYHFGVDEMGPDSKSTGGQTGPFFSRVTVGNAILSGSLNRYTIQHSSFVDKILLSPTLNDKQKGSVLSMWNITLSSVRPQSGEPEQLSNLVSLGSLVYRYDEPFSQSNQVRQGKPYQGPSSQRSSEENSHSSSSVSSSQETQPGYSSHSRPKRYLTPRQPHLKKNSQESSSSWSDSSDSSVDSEEYWQQNQPKLDQPPESPLLPFTVGYGGQSIKKNLNIVQIVVKLSQQIAQSLQHPEQMPKQNSVGKFVTLTSLIRVMSQKEIQEVAGQLYQKRQQGQQVESWAVFRDGVAQSGTGPALVCIQEWIKSSKISEEEAALLVSTTAKACRQPTYEYMRTFYQMWQTPEVMKQNKLNESALLSLADLVYKVYVNGKESHDNYPVHSFGAFRTREGYNFLKKEIIPFLGKQLHRAIENADTRKIHTYIRALGNVGHQNILQEFEPYLEGQKQASHFQRLLMVLSLDKLTLANPKLARSVLYKIYQNRNEHSQVRVAAVCQMMRTRPSADILKRMAILTHFDINQDVNAAVKSSIETASELKGADCAFLRNAAKTARPFLTKKNYGKQYSQNKLRSYVVEQMALTYKQWLQTFASEDSFLPNGLRYTLDSTTGGYKQQNIDAQAIVSSVDDLFNMLQQQTQAYKQQQQQGKSQNQWSSQRIAELLGMQIENAEQLEGFLHLQMGPYQDMLSFDNRSIERLPEALRKIEESLRQGKNFHHMKLIIRNEMAISFPTILGWPFIYTYDTPVVLNIKGKAQATATPPMASNNALNKPQNINGQYEIRMVIAGKTQSQLGFTTPFDHQRYSAGYDKNFQLNIPVRVKVNLDLKNHMQLQTEIQPLETGDWQLMHFSTWPYTAKNDIFTLQEERQTVQKQALPQTQYYFGEQITGMPIRLDVVNVKALNSAWLYKQLQDPVSALLGPWTDENIQNSKIDLYVDLKKCSSPKINLRVGYQSQYESQSQSQGGKPGNNLNQLYSITEEPLERQKQFINRASAGIQNAKSSVVDALVQFHGQEQISYRATIGASKSDVDPNSRVLAFWKKTIGQSQDKLYQIAIALDGHSPNTNGLDFSYAIQLNPRPTYTVQVAMGQKYENSNKFTTQVQLSKSEEWKQHLKEDYMFSECRRQMQEGNNALPACANMTVRANLLDQVLVKVEYNEVSQEIRNNTYKLYSHLRQLVYPRIDENVINATGTGKNEIHIQGRFSPDLRSASVSISTQKTQTNIEDIEVNDLARSMFVPHPVFHAKSRFIGKQLGYDVYRPICVVDKTAANTFDNKTYPISLSPEWTVMLQYVPQRPSQKGHNSHSLLNQQMDNYVVLVRDVSSQKEVMINLQTLKTQQQNVEVMIKPTGSKQTPKVLVNGKQVSYSKQQAADLFNGHVQIYELPNNEVKVELSDAFYVISDGNRLKLTVLDGKFRGSVRGLCGTFTGHQETDFMSPRECVLGNPQQFVSSYTLTSSHHQQQQQQQYQQSQYDSSQGRSAHGRKCYRQEIILGNYISNRDAGRVRFNRPNSNDMCTKHQTRYVTEKRNICFTLKPVPVCRNECQQQGTITKNIQVHCIESNNVSELWKKQIDKGASPDFSLKSPTKSIPLQVAASCTP